MPFAKSFRFVMRLPDPGNLVGPFTVDSCDVEHHPQGGGRYEYSVTMEVRGLGGVAGVKKAFRPLLTSGHSYFSAYGNPYQLGFAGYEVSALGNRRYRIDAKGVGHRFDLERELQRFLIYLDHNALEAGPAVIQRYLADYQRDVHRKNPDIAY